MSQTNGQHEEQSLNGPGGEGELSVPTGPPISDFLTQLQDYNTTIPGQCMFKHKMRGKRKLRDVNICCVIKIVKQSRKQ